jgi:2-dehydro-3-deoxy-L-rhamnonate dehydrogenase (NAD+)
MFALRGAALSAGVACVAVGQRRARQASCNGTLVDLFDPPTTRQHGRFAGKVVLITGGGGTFGREGAFFFHREGANVVLFDSSKKALEDASEELQGSVNRQSSLAGQISTCVVDVRDRDTVQRAVTWVHEKYGRIDYLWNNAGYQGEMKDVLEYPSRDLDLVLGINVIGSFNVLQACAKVMAAQTRGGSIVQSGSVAALEGTPTMVGYVASKAALHGITVGNTWPGGLKTFLIYL